MGEPLDSTRQTRFPRNPPSHVESQQLNLRELEDAIIWLQDQRTAMQSIIDEQSVSISNLITRITALENKNG